MARPAVTLRDVAEQAGVHPSTASRALDPRTQTMVNASTVTRVRKAAEGLGYRPNSLARGLKLNQTFTIGMLVPDLTNPLFPPIVRGIEDRLLDDGYTLVMANTDNDHEKEERILSSMMTRRVDGLILATARREYDLLDEILEAEIPVVLVNRTVDSSPVGSVTADDHTGIGHSVRHLAALGHRRIAYVGANHAVSTGFGRYQSYMSWMQTLGLPIDEDLVVIGDWFLEGAGERAFHELINRGVEFTAVVAANDRLALGCYSAIQAHGLRVPDDVSIVGYNDAPYSDKVSPPLTTIRVPLHQLGVKAADLLMDTIAGEDTAALSARLAPTLVERASTAPPRAAETEPVGLTAGTSVAAGDVSA